MSPPTSPLDPTATAVPEHSHFQQRVKLREGDHGVFNDLFTAHHGEVFASALRLTGHRASAEDVTSETFLVAWRRRTSVELSDVPLRGWLLAIATNQGLNVIRGRRRRLAFLGSAAARPDVVADIADEAVGRLDDIRLIALTRRALHTLTRKEVEVVSLCIWSGLTYAEAAQALGIPIGTVRSRLHRARERLRTLVLDHPTSGRGAISDHPEAATTPDPTCTHRGPR